MVREFEIDGAKVQGTKSGKNYKVVCPWHKEKTPSLVIFPDKKEFKCFGCGKKGVVK